MARIRIGISGWRYPPWRGSFYPEDLPQRAELSYAAGRVSIIEINGSFYSLQKPDSYAKWYAETPADFVFSVKGPKYITHVRRLREVETPLANFLASGLFNLRDKLGPLLWQFPPNFKFDRERMRAFLALLPRDLDAAAGVAQGRSEWMHEREQLIPQTRGPLRHAIEVRNASFADPDFISDLREFGVALVVSESAREWPMLHDVTADFIYMRLHGELELYKGGYRDEALAAWAERIRVWHAGGEPADAPKVVSGPPPGNAPRDVYCFFDNTDVKLRAPFDAQTLMGMLGLVKAGA